MEGCILGKTVKDRGLERCLFRLQGTLVQSGLKYKAHNDDRVEDKKP